MTTLAQPGILFTVGVFAGVIGLLVFIHEFGHYYVARLFGVRAETFAIGFGREIAGWTDSHGTRWRLGWLPLGGYVKFLGDANAASQPDPAVDRTPLAEREGLFHFAPLWQKALITVAGPATNFLFAILIYAVFFATYGQVTTPAIIDRIVAGSPAATAGLQPGDRIVAVDGATVTRFSDVVDRTVMNVGDPMMVSFRRGDILKTVEVRPRIVVEKDRFGQELKIPRMGFMVIGRARVEPVPLLQVVPRAVAETAFVVRSQAVGLWQIVSGRRSVKEMGGPVKMAQISGQVASIGWVNLVGLVALISINLGFINLLPIPMLDGGHLFLYALQAVRRRPLGARVQELAFLSGFAALVSLMVLLTFNDLGSIGVWKHLTGLFG